MIRRSFVAAAVLVAVAVTFGGWLPQSPRPVRRWRWARARPHDRRDHDRPVKQAPLFTDSPSVEAKYARNLQPVDLTMATKGYVPADDWQSGSQSYWA